MEMKRFAVTAALLFSGCQLTPDSPNMTMTVAGNYEAVADCVYLALSRQTALWQIDHLPSLQTVRLVQKLESSTVGHVEFKPAGAGTSVTMRMHDGIFVGQSEQLVRPKVEACAGLL